jgi:hypothetical protein
VKEGAAKAVAEVLHPHFGSRNTKGKNAIKWSVKEYAYVIRH